MSILTSLTYLFFVSEINRSVDKPTISILIGLKISKLAPLKKDHTTFGHGFMANVY